MIKIQNYEFGLHIHKKTATGQGQDLYTIGVWKGSTLRAICHVQPLDHALSALRKLLDQTGKSQTTVLSIQPRDVAQSPLRTGLRRIFATMLAPLASFIRSDR